MAVELYACDYAIGEGEGICAGVGGVVGAIEGDGVAGEGGIVAGESEAACCGGIADGLALAGSGLDYLAFEQACSKAR